jgi:hypothetical protein
MTHVRYETNRCPGPGPHNHYLSAEHINIKICRILAIISMKLVVSTHPAFIVEIPPAYHVPVLFV